jgi:hypothetical protein
LIKNKKNPIRISKITVARIISFTTTDPINFYKKQNPMRSRK